MDYQIIHENDKQQNVIVELSLEDLKIIQNFLLGIHKDHNGKTM